MLMMNSSKRIYDNMEKPKYTKKQQYAIIYILIQIMEADGIIDPGEVIFLNRILADFNISESELEIINSFEIHQSCTFLSDMPDVNKDYARSLFIGMAESDGYSDPRELKIIESLKF